MLKDTDFVTDDYRYHYNREFQNAKSPEIKANEYRQLYNDILPFRDVEGYKDILADIDLLSKESSWV